MQGSVCNKNQSCCAGIAAARQHIVCNVDLDAGELHGVEDEPELRGGEAGDLL